MKKCGIIDIGSNSIRLGLYTYDDYGFEVIDNYVTVKELASYVDKGNISQKGIDIALKTLISFKDIAKNRGVDDLYALVTAFGRKLDDPTSFIMQLNKEVPTILLSGDEEATLAFKGCKSKVDLKEGVMIDIGGGSFEMVQFCNEQIKYKTSIELGCVNLSKINPQEPLLYVNDLLKKIDHRFSGSLVGAGGTIESLFIIYDKMGDPRVKLSKFEVLNIINHYDNDAIHFIIGKYIDARKKTLWYGLQILYSIMEYYAIDDLYLSEYGVKEGYLIEHILNK
ncbi:MAG: hypothetical protein MR210_07330 [Erysipelotrichaceae bacterium]|nr:hypothetical protein [Erysipelotrichaceae bacterium]MDY5252702.1 hypothetical protein [Erysipelotrichaceae bacterium]